MSERVKVIKGVLVGQERPVRSGRVAVGLGVEFLMEHEKGNIRPQNSEDFGRQISAGPKYVLRGPFDMVSAFINGNASVIVVATEQHRVELRNSCRLRASPGSMTRWCGGGCQE